jgi:multiple sugar transport system ATP-binding protein
MRMATVSFDHVTKKYGEVTAVDDFNLEIADGEFMVFVGPSGCGKTTSLRMVAGLEDITAGTLSIGDRVVNDIAPKDRDIAMVFQSYALYPHMNVYDNLAFGLKLRKIDKKEIDRRVKEAAETIQLTTLLERKPKELSGGQRQRVALGRAIVREPAVFLMDEPLSSLDAKLRVEMRTELKRLHASLGATFVYVTHDQAEAMTMADRIVVLNGGRIEQVGAPLELYDRPANAFVATFIGSPSMNMLQGRMVGGFVETHGAKLNLPPGLSLEDGRAVTYGIRPEHLALDGQGLAGTVAVVEPTGSETHIVTRVDGQEITVVSRERVTVRPGDAITLAPASAAAHVFDTATGARLN